MHLVEDDAYCPRTTTSRLGNVEQSLDRPEIEWIVGEVFPLRLDALLGFCG